MGILAKFASVFSGGVSKSIEKVASEWIQTDIEKAEAQALMVKTLDPNGLMRRDLSRFACKAYGVYIITAMGLLVMAAFGVGDAAGADKALKLIGELFLPITTAWGGIVGASFGVNGLNTHKGK